MGQKSFDKSQIHVLVSIEQASAVLSVISTAVVIITFSTAKAFRTPSNTLIIFAAPGNLLSNVAHLIGVAGIAAGTESALCQIQGLLLQMCMPADSLWSLAIAVNVYLVVFRRYEVSSLKRLHWLYFIISYGLPFTPAFTYLIMDVRDHRGVYGDATLWCWISQEWALLRLTTYYAPIWTVMLLIFSIYVRVGKFIYTKRRNLKYFSNSNDKDPKEPFGGVQITHVEVTSADRNEYINNSIIPNRSRSKNRVEIPEQYSITISSSPPTEHGLEAIKPPPTHKERRPARFFKKDAVVWAYTKCAALMAASLFITWFPASVNRVYSLVYSGEVSYSLNVASALLLPLQGFWNAVIFFMTSLPACKALWASTFKARDEDRFLSRTVGMASLHHPREETDSTVELSTDMQVRPF